TAGGQGPGGGTPGAPAANAPASAPSSAAQSAAPQGSQPRPSGTATAEQTQPPRQGSGQAPANAQNGQPRENRGQGDQQARDGQPNQGGRGGFANMTPEERQKRMQERMAARKPGQRGPFEERKKQGA